MENYYAKLASKYKAKSHNPNYKKTHFIEIPARIVLVGQSGSGKTNAALNILKAFNGTFDRVVLVCKSVSGDPLYEMLHDKLGDAMEIHEDGEVPSLDEFDGDGQTLFIADDLVGDKAATKTMIEHFKRGRKKGITYMYLSQSWFKIDKFIRQNTSHVVIKKVSSVKDLKLILSEFPLNCDIDDLKQMYDYATSRFEDVLFIDLLNGHIYKNLTERLL
jgi:hypothetical protein